MEVESGPSIFAQPRFAWPVLITGLPRSGTSLVAGLLNACGLWLGNTLPGGQENPRGFFENVALREKLQKQILALGKFDPFGVVRLPPPDWRPVIGKFRDAIGMMLVEQGYEGKEPWGFKDAKLTLTWRIWNQHFPAARWILVRRPSDQVISSCLRTHFMRAHSTDPAFWRHFVNAYLERLAELEGTVAWVRTVESVPIIAGNYDSLERVVRDLELEWRGEAVRAFVMPEHWHRPQETA
jgi:hypothetical protein